MTPEDTNASGASPRRGHDDQAALILRHDLAQEVRTAAAFAVEARAHWSNVAADADIERVFLGLEAEAHRAQRRLFGVEIAVRLGVPALAQVFEVLALSERRELRERAAGLIVRAVLRRTSEMAA